MTVKLTDLDPQFYAWVSATAHRKVETLAEADGLFFACPLCYSNNGARRPGVHGIICWAPHVPQTARPGPGRWEMLGTGYADLTLRAAASSVHLTGPGCGAHFNLTNGECIW